MYEEGERSVQNFQLDISRSFSPRQVLTRAMRHEHKGVKPELRRLAIGVQVLDSRERLANCTRAWFPGKVKQGRLLSFVLES